jgi:hypothetical protein
VEKWLRNNYPAVKAPEAATVDIKSKNRKKVALTRA